MKTQIIRRTVLVVAITLFCVVNNNGSAMKATHSSVNNIITHAVEQPNQNNTNNDNTDTKNSLYFIANKREDDEINEANFFHLETTEEDAKNLLHLKKIMEAVYCLAYSISYISYIILLFSL
jgi:hypothetical protein